MQKKIFQIRHSTQDTKRIIVSNILIFFMLAYALRYISIFSWANWEYYEKLKVSKLL